MMLPQLLRFHPFNNRNSRWFRILVLFQMFLRRIFRPQRMPGRYSSLINSTYGIYMLDIAIPLASLISQIWVPHTTNIHQYITPIFPDRFRRAILPWRLSMLGPHSKDHLEVYESPSSHCQRRWIQLRDNKIWH